MEGIAERDRRAVGDLVAQAWWTERLAREDKLKGLTHYLDGLKPKKKQSAEEMLDVFREYQSRGAPIAIRRFGADGKELN